MEYYILILVGKIIEVSIATMRVVLISKGEKKIGTFLAFIEIILWLLLVAKVLTDLSSDPYKGLAYAIGFTIGNYLGSTLENIFGIGTSQLQVIVGVEKSEEICDILYNRGFAYTRVEAMGRVKERTIVYTLLPRSSVKKIIKELKEASEDTFISVHETKPIKGGYGLKRK